MRATSSILLVDDNAAWRETLAEVLRDQGFNVATAEGSLSGQALLDQADFFAAVIDNHMADMSGLEWLPALRDRLPVLMLSSEDDPQTVELAIEEGALAFLSKSQPPRQLLPNLRRMVLLAYVVCVARRILAGDRDEVPALPPPHRAA